MHLTRAGGVCSGFGPGFGKVCAPAEPKGTPTSQEKIFVEKA